MRLQASTLVLSMCVAGAAVIPAVAQRHDGGSSPPTAPPRPVVVVPQVSPVSSDLGALQFTTGNFTVSAPQSLIRQLQVSDERTRVAALAALGVPAQYMVHGHVAYPHSVHLDLVALGGAEELDAILTVELDQHIVSAILTPEEEEWHRVGTMLYATAFSDTNTTPSTFLRLDRSLMESRRYTAVYHASVVDANGGFTESEAHLRMLNHRAILTLSFTSAERTCDPLHPHACEMVERWVQADAVDPAHHFLLVTATGHVRSGEAGDPISSTETYETAHLRTFECQPLTFSEATQHFEPTANPAPCVAPREAQAANPSHPTSRPN
jgi:hypothetical protein